MGADRYGHCQGCKHWLPLFTGEAWGVRSLADAPPEERERVMAELELWRRDDDWYRQYQQEAVTPGKQEYYEPGGVEETIMPEREWPLWGECDLASMGSTTASKARAIDGSLYRAELRCRYDFGCVQWEAMLTPPGDAPGE